MASVSTDCCCIQLATTSNSALAAGLQPVQASSTTAPAAVTKFSRNQDGSLTNRSQVLATFLPPSQQPKQPATVAEDGDEDDDDDEEGGKPAAGGSSGGAKPAKKKKSGSKKKKGKK
jgi:hypothetical protein